MHMVRNSTNTPQLTGSRSAVGTESTLVGMQTITCMDSTQPELEAPNTAEESNVSGLQVSRTKEHFESCSEKLFWFCAWVPVSDKWP